MLTSYRLNKRVLGIAVGERSLLAAEVLRGRTGPQLLRSAAWNYPEGACFSDPQALGAAAGQFLRQNAFSAVCAVVGIPAKWLILRPHRLPPADPQSALAMLNLQAQSIAAPELGEIIFEYSGQFDADAASTVSLIGLPRSWRERLLTFCAAAGLKPLAILPSTAALAANSGGQFLSHRQPAMVLSTSGQGAELAVLDGSRIALLRHLTASSAPSAIAAELRRAIAMLPAGTGPDAPARGIVLWDDTALSPADHAQISSAAGIAIIPADSKSLASDSPTSKTCAPASAVALAVTDLSNLSTTIDFLHPRLAQTTRRLPAKRTLWVAGVAAAIALVALVVYFDLSRLWHDMSQTDQQLASIAPAAAKAKPFVAAMQPAEAFQQTPPKDLACLRDITSMLPENGQTFLTGFHLQGNMRGDLAGRSSSNDDVLGFMYKFQVGGRFADVRRNIEGRGANGEVTFSVTFTYLPRE